MSDFDNAIGDMTTDMLTEAGGSFVYRRGTLKTTLTLRKSMQSPTLIDKGEGLIIEVQSVDFIGLTIAMPYDPPERGDQIVGGGFTYEVQPTVSEKVFRRISQQMTRIHTKQIG